MRVSNANHLSRDVSRTRCIPNEMKAFSGMQEKTEGHRKDALYTKAIAIKNALNIHTA